MRVAVPVLALALGGCFEESRTLALDVDEVHVPMGAGAEIGVWIDGTELTRLDSSFSWVVDQPELVSVTRVGAKVRVTGKREGQTIVHLGYRTSVVDVPTYILEPAVVALTVDPTSVSAAIGAMVAVRATATYTTGDVVDVSSSAVWTIDDPSIASVTPIDADGQPDFRVATTDGRTVLLECKTASANLYKDRAFKVEVQKTRDSGAGRQYTFDQFDALAACLFSATGSWHYRFRWTKDLAPFAKDPTRIKPVQRIDESWAKSFAELLDSAQS